MFWFLYIFRSATHYRIVLKEPVWQKAVISCLGKASSLQV